MNSFYCSLRHIKRPLDDNPCERGDKQLTNELYNVIMLNHIFFVFIVSEFFF